VSARFPAGLVARSNGPVPVSLDCCRDESHLQQQALVGERIDTLRMRIMRPFANPSAKEPIAHSWFVRIKRDSISCSRTSRLHRRRAQPSAAQHRADKVASHSPLVRYATAPHALFDISSAASIWPASPRRRATPRSDPASDRTGACLEVAVNPAGEGPASRT